MLTARRERQSRTRLRFNRTGVALVGLLLVVLAGAAGWWAFRDHLRSPQALYTEAQRARPERAAVLYQRLVEEMPSLQEYGGMWAAQAAMPDLEAMRSLQAVISFRPESPAAREAHIALARYYASIEAAEAEEAYRAALALHETIALRLELARFLEERGDNVGAYGEHWQLLDEQADAFAGMRRTGADPLAVAEDLNIATYFSDAFETLRGIDDVEALPLRARALAGLERPTEAEEAYQAWLVETPDDADAQVGLARVLEGLDRDVEALALYRSADNSDSLLGQGDLLEEKDPDQALAFYLECPYPVAWWSATALLEELGRPAEALPVYARVARTSTYFADDAAYRLYVLARRIGDEEARAEAEGLLEGLGLNWLALRATGGELVLPAAAPLIPAGGDVLGKVQALEAIGRNDLAQMELVMAARFRQAPEVILAAAEALSARGDVVQAQAIGQKEIADHPRAPIGFWELSYPRPYSATVQTEAAEFGVDPLLIWSVMREESRYDPEALSWVGARGLMQVMPPTQEWIAGELGEAISPGDAYTPEASIRMAAWFLGFLQDYFGGDLELVIAAYNGGAGSVETWLADPMVNNRDDLLRWIGFGETREYVSRVSLSHRVYQALYGAE